MAELVAEAAIAAAATAGAATAAVNDKENLAQQQQAEALREHVYRQVLSSDVLSSVKAHLRARLYAELKGCGSSSTAAVSVPGGWQPLQPPACSPNLQQHVLNCLLAEYLLAQQYRYTLSVFLAESGSNTLPRLGHADILRLVGVLPESKVYALLIGSGSGSATSSGGRGRVTGETDATSSQCNILAPCPSLAESMVVALGKLGGHVSYCSAACQTQGDGEAGSYGSGYSAALTSQQLMQRLQAIEEEYQRKSSSLEQTAAQSLKERMAAHQRECDARCSAQLEERLGALQHTELAAAREAEATRCRQQLEAERVALQQVHQERLARLNKQEEELLERRRRVARDLDLAGEEHLRRMRGDEERLAACRAESEAKLVAAQAAAKLAVQQAEAAERRAEAQREEGEARLQARLTKLQAREAEALRQQATAEAELGHVVGLQRQLAAALEEQGGLRQQLAAARSIHQAEQAELKLELESLRRHVPQLEAAEAARAAAPGLMPGDAIKLKRAVRRLLTRVEELQGEVAACRERERLWRGSAADADKLLDKSAKGQDRALQHGEELRLALAAATREVSDLQQQADLAGAGTEGPLAVALQAASRDAQRWREHAEARVEAAKREEEDLRQQAAQLRQRALANRTAVAQGLQRVLQTYGLARRQELGDVGEGNPGEPLAPVAAPPPPTAAPVVPTAATAVQPAGGAPSYSIPVVQWRPSELPAPVQQPPPAQQQQPPAPPAMTNSFGGSLWAQYQAQQQQQQESAVAVTAPPKPPSRTASDILAAYRARQQRAAGSGSATGAGFSSSGVSREASASDEAQTAGGGGGEEGATPGQQQGPDPSAAAPAAGRAAAGEAGADAEGYYVSDFTSDDSSRF